MPEQQKNPNRIILPHNSNVLYIDLFGGSISKLIFGQCPVLISPKRGDGRIASTHLCLPMLGPDTRKLKDESLRLSQHGPARNDLWTVKNNSDGQLVLEYCILNGSHQGLSALVAHQWENNTYSNSTVIKNQSKNNLPINPGWHLYWKRTPKGTIQLNGKDISGLIRPESSIVSLEEKNIITVPHMYEVVLEQNNFPLAVLWNGKNPQNEEDNDYFCLEPIASDPSNFGKKDSILQSGKQITYKFSINI